MRRLHLLISVLLIGLLLLSAGCAKAGPEPMPSASEPPSLPAAAATEAPTEPQAPEEAAYPDPSLVSLRQAMIETPQHFAVAYFGYALPDAAAPVDPHAVMAGISPELCADLPFLLQIPSEQWVGTEGHLLCIVPADENATVAVNHHPWDEETGLWGEPTVLYRSEMGDPILLLTANRVDLAETEVVITDSWGNVTSWYPLISLENEIIPVWDENSQNIYFDFSPYDQINNEDSRDPVPGDLEGTWELVWTEVEGDRNEVAPGSCILEITEYGTDYFLITCRNQNFPEENYTDRELAVFAGELYPGCGNSQWIAEVYLEPGEPVTHTMTVLSDGMLLMQNSWFLDGIPMVSYEWYERVIG